MNGDGAVSCKISSEDATLATTTTTIPTQTDKVRRGKAKRKKHAGEEKTRSPRPKRRSGGGRRARSRALGWRMGRDSPPSVAACAYAAHTAMQAPKRATLLEDIIFSFFLL